MAGSAAAAPACPALIDCSPEPVVQLESSGRLGHFESTGAGTQRLGHTDAAVGLLVVLQDGDQPAGGRQGAVQGGGDLRLADLVPTADAQPPGLDE